MVSEAITTTAKMTYNAIGLKQIPLHGALTTTEAHSWKMFELRLEKVVKVTIQLSSPGENVEQHEPERRRWYLVEIISRSGEVKSILVLEKEVVPSGLDLMDLASDRPPIAPSHIHRETILSPTQNLCFAELAKLFWLMLTS
ncbi:MAG: hypothetical protein Q9191_002776 [Dirinaria sp. TL-2023a]